MQRRTVTVADVLAALDRLTRGRLLPVGSDPAAAGRHPYVIWKSSGIPGKQVLETPGLVVGSPEQPVHRVAMGITLTESVIELAGATGVDLLISHHPVADAASSGGVPLARYLGLYGLALIELHEAFHGLHPGIPFLHGLRPMHYEVGFGGIPGHVVVVGEPLGEIRCLGDIVRRLDSWMGLDREVAALARERELAGSDGVQSATVATRSRILLGRPEDEVTGIIQIFPHSGTEPRHLLELADRFAFCNTVVASISRVVAGSPLVKAAARRGLHFVLGNSHPFEVFENWLPLARALERLLPELEIVIWQQPVFTVPLQAAGSPELRAYAEEMAAYLLGSPRV